MKDNRRSGRSPRKESTKRPSGKRIGKSISDDRKDDTSSRPSGSFRSRGYGDQSPKRSFGRSERSDGFDRKSPRGESNKPSRYNSKESQREEGRGDFKRSKFRAGGPPKRSFGRDENRGEAKREFGATRNRREGFKGDEGKKDFRRSKYGSSRNHTDGYKSRESGSDEGKKDLGRSKFGSDRNRNDGYKSREIGSDEEKKDFGRSKYGSDRNRAGGFKRTDKHDEGKRSFGRNKFEGERSRKSGFARNEKRDDRPRSYSNRRVGRPTKAHSSKFENADSSGLIRLNKYISNSGVCSRREADELISMGLVSVNGTVVTEMGHKVKLTDDVRYESRKLHPEKRVYILLNKPKGYITTTDDPQERSTVMNLIQGACKERVYPVGRLDRNTSGLLLFTNDGELADKLTHPSYNTKKIYKVELDRPITKNDFDKIQKGIHLEEGLVPIDEIAIISDDKKTIGIELHIGWNRIVRRIFESLEYEVVKLDRSVFAGLTKKDVPRGKWRFLEPEEVVHLKHFK